MISTPWLWIGGLLLAWIALIYYWGTARFGRNQTQLWIDALSRRPWGRAAAAFFDRNHGFFRAAWHYVEFGTLSLLALALATGGTFRVRSVWPYVAWAATCFVAYLDEVHQARTPGRMFRRIDFMHSLLGASLAFFLVLLFNLLA